jgi:hypothetical protein
MQTKRRRETIEQARGVARLCIALRKIGRSPESEQRKKHAHEQQAKANQRAWINECGAGGGVLFHIGVTNSGGQEFVGGGFSEAYVLFSLSARVNPILSILENFPS